MRTRTREPWMGATALAAAAACAVAVSALPPERTAQVGGADLLSVLFADARAVAGLALVHKADRYFHGGVEIDYCDRGRPAEAGSAPAGSAAERDDHVDHEREARPVARDPWSWVNARVHVQDHRHLAGREVDEMIPWIWAACRADPNNVEAWEIGWYALAKMRKNKEAGLAVLEAGIRHNPDNVHLEFTRGQSLLTDFQDETASEAAFQLARSKALAPVDGTPEKLDKDDALLLTHVLSYLGHFAEKRGDAEAIRRYHQEAVAAAPDSPSTRYLGSLLETARP